MTQPVHFQITASAAGARKAQEEVKSGFTSVKEEARSAAAVAKEAARVQVQALISQRAELRANIVALKELAAESKRGSDVQTAALKIAKDEAAKLKAAYIGVGEAATAAGHQAARATREGARASSEERGFLRGAAGRGLGFASNTFLAGAVGGLEVKSILDETKLAQASQAQLRNALTDSGIAWRDNQKHIENNLASLEKLSGFDRVSLRESFAMILRGTHDVGKATDQMNIVVDVARGRHMELAAATNLVARAQLGNVGAARRLGIDVQKVTTYEDELKAAHVKASVELTRHAKALDLDATKLAVLEALHSKFSGSASAYSKTLAGRLDALHNSYRELEVEIGTAITPTVQHWVTWLTKEIDKARESKTLHAELRSGLHQLQQVMGIVVAVFKIAFSVMRDGVDAVGGVKHAVEILLAVMAVNKLRAIAGGITKYLIKQGIVLVGEEAIAAAGITEGAFLGIGISAAALGGVIKAALITTGIGLVIVAVGILAYEFITHFKEIKHYVMEFADWLMAKFKELIGFIGNLLSKIPSWMPGVGQFHDWGVMMKNWADDTGNKTGKAFVDAFNNQMAGMTVAGTQGLPGTGGLIPTVTGKGVQVPTSFKSTHETRGLPGFPAVDIMAKPGTPVRAPEDGMITRISGSEPSLPPSQGQGGPWGLSIYFVGTDSGNTYYLTHLMKVAEPGHYAKGDVIGLVGDYPGSASDHVHVGLHQGSSSEASAGSGLYAAADYLGSKAQVARAKNRTAATKAIYTAADLAKDIANSPRKQKKTASLGEPALLSLRSTIDRSLKRELPDQLDAAERIAVAHIRKLEASLHVGESPTEVAKTKAALGMWGDRLKKEIKDNAKKAHDQANIEKAAARRAAADIAAAFAAGWSADKTLIDRSIAEAWAGIQKVFDRETSAHLQKMQRDAQAGMQGLQRAFAAQMLEFDRETQRQITKLQRDYQIQQTAFDRATQKGLQGFVVDQTPEEKALADFEATRAATDLAKQDAQRQADLAQAISGGDPTQIAQAQDAINQAALDAQDAGLKAAAEASRKAQDAKTNDAQQAYQDQRDALRQSLDDQENILEQGLQDQRDALKQKLTDDETALEQSFQDKADLAAQAYQDERDAAWQHMDDMHADALVQFDADLESWKRWIGEKTKTWADFLKWMQQNPVSKGVNGGAITDPAVSAGYVATAAAAQAASAAGDYSMAAYLRAAAHPQAAGGDYMVRKPTLFLAGEAGLERATFTPGGGSQGGNTYVNVEINAGHVTDRDELVDTVRRTMLEIGRRNGSKTGAIFGGRA